MSRLELLLINPTLDLCPVTSCKYENISENVDRLLRNRVSPDQLCLNELSAGLWTGGWTESTLLQAAPLE